MWGKDEMNKTDASMTTTDEAIDKIKNIVPMINKHILALEETPKGYKLWNFPVKMVQVCGVLKSTNIIALQGRYVIEDFSGEITVVRYFGEETNRLQHQTNTYVEVSGFLRDQKGERFIAATYEPRSIESVNYINTHVLNALHAWCKFKSTSRELNSSMVTDTNETSTVVPQNVSESRMTQVLDYLRADNSPAGLNVEDIAKGLKCNPRELTKIMESLSSEGHIYSTINEYHFKAT